jgi:hypothetical protein
VEIFPFSSNSVLPAMMGIIAIITQEYGSNAYQVLHVLAFSKCWLSIAVTRTDWVSTICQAWQVLLTT